MKYSSRFFLYAPLALLLILASLAMIHWWIDASALAKRLDAVNGHEIMPGVRMSFAQKRIAGFPFRLDTILKNLRIEVQDADGPVVWTTQDFAMHSLTYGRVQAIFEAAGTQTLSWQDARGAAHRFTFLPGSFHASALLQDGRLMRFDAEIVDLDGADFRAADVQFDFRRRGDALQTFLGLKRARLSGGYAGALGPELEELRALATLDQASALDKLFRGEDSPKRALEDWRRTGTVHVDSLGLAWKTRNAVFAGRLALDTHHDLSGVLVSTFAPRQTLDFRGDRIALPASGLLP
jgi:hypothetical protein